ncbi:MAG: hypothetical protein AB7O67_15280 [Vicinamibacterales bacterium]
MSRLKDIHGEARAEWSRLQEHWRNARSQWTDGVASDFERRQWQAWEETVPAYLDALQELEEVTSRALRET